MVWRLEEVTAADTEIVVYNGTPDPAPLTDNAVDDRLNRINNIGQVVWVNHEDPDNSKVMLYDGMTIETVFDGGQMDFAWEKFPQINDNGNIVWHSRIDGDWRIMHYEPGLGVGEIATSTLSNIYPVINNHQQMASIGFSTYSSEDGAVNPAVYLHNAGRDVQLSPTGIDVDRVSINDSGYILWRQFDGNDWEIMLAVPEEVEETAWAQTYSGEARDEAHDVIETADFGYLVAGGTRSFGAAEEDAWVLKLDAQGAIEWERRYGGPADDVANCVREVPGGYLPAGSTASFGAGTKDAWLVKLDMLGNVLWEKSYGDFEDEEMACVEITDNGAGDYVFAATSWSFESGGYPEYPYSHVWLVKVDKYTGNVIWQRSYALSPQDFAHSIEETADGGLIVGATANAPGLGNHDFWILKLTEHGIVEWQKAYGQNEFVPADPWFHYSEYNAYVSQTWDGGYIVAGISVSHNTQTAASWTVKLDPDGVIEWNKWGGVPYVTGLQQLNNGEYAVLGRTGWPSPSSFDDPHKGRLIKFDAEGYVPWEATYKRDPAKDDKFAGFMQTWDDGYIVAGGTGLGYESGDAWVLKLDASGMASTDCEAVEINDSGYSMPDSLNALTVNTAAIVTVTDVFVTDTMAYTDSGCEVILPDLIDLARTGQTTSYLPGDDGDQQVGAAWPNPRFVDLGDGTIRDRLTGLVCLQDANCALSSGYDHDEYWTDGMLWYLTAYAFIEELNAGTLDSAACGYSGDYDDWRLANVKEMESLLNHEHANALEWLEAPGIGFLNVGGIVNNSPNHTSTTAITNWSWRVRTNGQMVIGSKDAGGGFAALVWPVREGQTDEPDQAYPANIARTGQVYDDPAVTSEDGELQRGVQWPVPRFFDNGDGTITDGLTGLVWMRHSSCLGIYLPWSDALAAVASFNDDPSNYPTCSYGGDEAGWRMPNLNELKSLKQYRGTAYAGLPDGHPFIGLTAITYLYHWSSTTYAGDPTKAWMIRVEPNGEINTRDKPNDNGGTVWLVRAPADTDADGILDHEDNCIEVANGPAIPDEGGNIQLDIDGDGYGNICDPDFDQSGVVNAADLAYMRTHFFTTDPLADLTGNGIVNAADLAIIKIMFFGPPGPSGLVP